MKGLETDYLNQCRKELVGETGILIPILRIRDNTSLQDDEFRILSYDKVLWLGCVDMSDDVYQFMISQVKEVCREHYDLIINKQCVKQLIDMLRENYPAVVEGLVPEKISYLQVQRRLQEVLRETGTIRDLIHILEDLEDQGKYIYMGWYTSNKENAEKVTSIDTSKLGNIVLYAQWENDELYYASEKYKVGENDIDIYEDGDIYLDKIEPNTTVKELTENSDTNGLITVIDAEGNELEGDDLVGTGMTIKVRRYQEEITMTAVVMGDLNGDGIVTATDLSALNQTILKLTTIEGAVFMAADLDDNDKLTATDLSTINNAILGNIKLTYEKEKNDNSNQT